MPTAPALRPDRWTLLLALLALAVACAACTPRASSSRAPAPARPSASTVSPPAPAPRFVGDVFPLDLDTRRHLLAMNWHRGCPVPLADLRLVEVTYRDFKGRVRSGSLVLHEQVAGDVLWVFRRLFRADFPIHRIGLAPRPQPIDWDSTRNLSSSFNCREATGNPGSLSQHSYGWAVDINPLQNPYVNGDGSVLRAATKPYVDRSRDRPGMIHAGDVVVRSFAAIGWGWGGDWTTIKDYMHFSRTGR